MVVLRRLRASVAFALMLALVVSTGVLAQAADEPAPETEITKQVEITVSDLMPTDRDGRYYVEVRLHNKTRSNLAGPIYISVESLGVDELVLDSADSKLSDGTRCVRIVSDVSQIRANADSASKRVYFKSDAELTAEQTEKFDATLTVWQGKKVPGQTRQTTERRDSGFPSGQSTAESGRTGQQAGPMPDPAFEKEGAETGTEEANAEDDKKNRKELKLPTDEEVAKVIQSQEQIKPIVHQIPGVFATSTSLSDKGTAVIRVYVNEINALDAVPKEFNGVPVEAKFMNGKAGFRQLGSIDEFPTGNRGNAVQVMPCANPRRHFTRPIPIGVSGFNGGLAMCATGTLGCRVRDSSGNVYVLSNSHVLADFGSALVAVGDPVVQPGQLDFNCTAPDVNVIGSLTDWTVLNPLGPNLIDAAIAQVSPLTVGVATPCDGYGVPRENVINATLGMRIMKYGRTSNLKASVVTSINMDVLIPGFTFLDLYEAIPALSDSGDSGSLVVRLETRESVGLIFAGNFDAFGNPIDDWVIPIQRVLDRFGVEIDGDPSLP